MWFLSMARSTAERPAPGEFPLPGLWPHVLGLVVVLLSAACTPVQQLQEWTLQAEPMSVLGTEQDGANAAFYNPTDLGFDAAGRLHVLDGGNHRVQVFDPEGRYLRTVGNGHGPGPGQMERPEGLWVYPDGRIVVADTGNRRLQTFGPAGDIEATVNLEYLPLDVVGTPERLYVLRLAPPTNLLGPDATPLVQLFDSKGQPLGGAVAPRADSIGLLYFLANTLLLAPSPDGGFAVAETHQYSRIRRYDARGNAVAEIPVLYKPQALAPLGRLPRRIDEATLVRIAKTAVDLCWDPYRGIYWVLAGNVDKTSDGGWVTATEVYRYAPGGQYRGTVMLPFRGVAVAAAPDYSVWVLDTDGLAHRLRIRDADDPAVAPVAPR